MQRLVLVSLFTLTACGGDDGGGGTVDAATQTPDMMTTTNKVITVTCPGGSIPEVTVSTGGGSYMPASTTISVNGIVRFTMPADHNVTPNTIQPSDPGLVVGFGQTRCLQFTMAGTYSFFCTPHGFTGTITVN